MMQRRVNWGRLASLGFLLAGLTGCQTWTWDSGMTLPSGHYLQHQPQYIPKSPQYRFSRELAVMQENEQAANPTTPGPLPAPVVLPP